MQQRRGLYFAHSRPGIHRDSEAFASLMYDDRQKNPLKYNPRLCCFSQIMKVGIFGGTFNPIHYGHLRAAEEVREQLGLDRVLFVPSGNPPLKTKDIAPARHRFAMVKLAVKDNRLFHCRISRADCRGNPIPSRQ